MVLSSMWTFFSMRRSLRRALVAAPSEAAMRAPSGISALFDLAPAFLTGVDESGHVLNGCKLAVAHGREDLVSGSHVPFDAEVERLRAADVNGVEVLRIGLRFDFSSLHR